MKKDKQSPVNPCRNTFIEADGYRNACGKRHYNPRKDASKQRLVAKPASTNEVVFLDKELSNEQK